MTMPSKIFTLHLSPPRTTHQQKKVAIIHGQPRFYEPASLKEARKTLMDALEIFAPDVPIQGPVSLDTTWIYKASKKSDIGKFKVTRPDTDNMIKLFKDCMTRCGYWIDDSQVVMENTAKTWGEDGKIIVNLTWGFTDPCELIMETKADLFK